MANTVTKVFTQASQTKTINIPGGVTNVRVQAIQNPVSLMPGSGLIDATGKIWRWGYNANGEVGDGTVVPKSSPVQVLGALQLVNTKTLNKDSSLSTNFQIASNGQVYAWGLNNASGLLGNNGTTSVSSPVLVSGNLFFKQVCNGGLTSFGVNASGQAYGWGTNTNGQIGDTTVANKSSPVLVAGGLSFSKVIYDSVIQTTVGITTSGAIYCWGLNANGQCGDGSSVVSKSSPSLVVGGLTFLDFDTAWHGVGGGCVCGLTTSGDLYVWGKGSFGQSGNSTITDKSSPVLVSGGLKFSSIAGGNNCFYGITTSGTMYSWGYNINGQLGVGDNNDRSSPVLVLGNLTWSYVKHGNVGGVPASNPVIAVTTSGVLYSWGYNANGELGDGTVIPKSSPVLVAGNLTPIDVQPGTQPQSNRCIMSMIATDGNLYMWGINPNGDLGVGDVVPRSSPTLVLGQLAPKIYNPAVITNITVVPGTTYTISLNKYNAFFGSIPVGNGPFDSIIVQYDQ